MFLFSSRLRSSLPTVQLRLSCSALRVREGAQSPSRQEFGQTNGPDLVCAQHPSVLLPGERFISLSAQREQLAADRTLMFLLCLFRLLWKICSPSSAASSLSSWETTRVLLRSLNLNCPGSSDQLRNKLAFIWLFKNSSVLYTASYIWLSLFCSFQGFKVGYIVFKSPSSLAAAKSHPQDDPLVVCTELRPVKTGVQSEWISCGCACWSVRQRSHIM